MVPKKILLAVFLSEMLAAALGAFIGVRMWQSTNVDGWKAIVDKDGRILDLYRIERQ